MMVMSLGVMSVIQPPPRTGFEPINKTHQSIQSIKSIDRRRQRSGINPIKINNNVRVFLTRDGCAAKGIAFVMGLSLLLCPGISSNSEYAHAFDFSLEFFQRTPAIEKDPVEPFTLYGSIFKKYFLENLVDGKVVSRKKGFTSTACVNALDASQETPELQGIPGGLKVLINGDPLCSKSEGKTREETCPLACTSACRRAIRQHLKEVTEETGYVLDSKDTNKVMEACSNQCTNECKFPFLLLCFNSNKKYVQATATFLLTI